MKLAPIDRVLQKISEEIALKQVDAQNWGRAMVEGKG
jgi:hypothetical protein